MPKANIPTAIPINFFMSFTLLVELSVKLQIPSLLPCYLHSSLLFFSSSALAFSEKQTFLSPFPTEAGRRKQAVVTGVMKRKRSSNELKVRVQFFSVNLKVAWQQRATVLLADHAANMAKSTLSIAIEKDIING